MADPVLTLPDLDDWIAAEIRKITRQGVDAKTRHLRRVIDEAFFLRRPHRAGMRPPFDAKYPAWYQHFFASAFAASKLKAGLGGSTGKYWRYLDPFFDYPKGNTGYGFGEVKPYILKAHVVDALTGIWRDGQSKVINRLTGTEFQSTDLPANGIVRTSFSSTSIDPLIPVDMERVDRAIDLLEGLGGLLGEKLFVGYRRRHVRTLRRLYLARQWVRNLGGIPNLYADFKIQPELGTGRLYGIGQLHLQTLSRDVRKFLYAGTGWWDYDFRACHPTIFLALAHASGFEMPFLSDFLSVREERSRELAESWDIPTPKIKTIFNALVYGQSLALSRYNSLWSYVGQEGIKTIRSDLYYLAIRGEIKDAVPKIIEGYQIGEVVANVVGKILPVLNPKTQRKRKWSKLLSHILTGYEAWALNLACRSKTDLVALMHDGWVCKSRRDVAQTEHELAVESEKEFGFEIPLKIKERQFA